MIKLNENTGLPYLPEDVGMRLANCVVMYDGKPVMLGDVMHNAEEQSVIINARYLSNGRNFIISLPDEKLDLTPVPVGYVNYGKDAVYVSRVPVRRYKQGLCHHNMRTRYANPMVPNVRTASILSSRGMSECITDDYYTLNDCIKLLEEGERSSVAFHRRWALYEDEAIGVRHLMYRGRQVGIYGEHGPELGRKFRYLAEELERMQA